MQENKGNIQKRLKMCSIPAACMFFILSGVWYGTVAPQKELDTEKLIISSAVYEPKEISVEVAGAVLYPDRYVVDKKTTVSGLISLAGGFTNKADKGRLNMEDAIFHGQRIYVPTLGETTRSLISYAEEPSQKVQTEEKININTAGAEDLVSLPGIGEALADSIIRDRSANGRFDEIADIMRIERIGEGLFEKIKDYITVE